MKGTINKWIESKGFGFITGEDNKNYFLHVSEVANQSVPVLGDEIEFLPMNTKKGMQAKKATIL